MTEISPAPEKPKRSRTPLSRVKKLDPETAKLLLSIRDKVNKKDHGRKVRDADILAKALQLLTSVHIQELQAQTYSQKDHLQIAYEEFQKAHGKITMDEFLGKLMRGEVRSKSNPSAEQLGSIPLK